MVSSFSFLPEFQSEKLEPQIAPRIAVGAASPLWLMFGAAAAAGAAYWWWASRWREAVNLEALMALAPEPVAPALEAEETLRTTPEPVVEAVTAATEAAGPRGATHSTLMPSRSSDSRRSPPGANATTTWCSRPWSAPQTSR